MRRYAATELAFIQDSRFRYLAIAQGLGAILGLLGTRFWAALAPGVVSTLALALALAYFSLAVFASFLLWRRHPLGIPLSLIVQVPQVVAILDPEGSFYFLVGLHTRLCLSADGISVGVGGGGVAEATAILGLVPGRLGADFQLTFTHRFQPPTGAGRYCLNVLAAIVSIWLMREWTRGDHQAEKLGSTRHRRLHN